jgi:hypothetical protein
MGCDIFSWAEVYVPKVGEWKAVVDAFPADAFEREYDHLEFVSSPFRRRDYGLFGFLAGVRNYAHCEPLAEPRGLPPGCDVEGGCRVNDVDSLDEFHSHSWFLLSELLAFDYDRQFWNRRIHRGKDGAAVAVEGGGYTSNLSRIPWTSLYGSTRISQALGKTRSGARGLLLRRLTTDSTARPVGGWAGPSPTGDLRR